MVCIKLHVYMICNWRRKRRSANWQNFQQTELSKLLSSKKSLTPAFLKRLAFEGKHSYKPQSSVGRFGSSAEGAFIEKTSFINIIDDFSKRLALNREYIYTRGSSNNREDAEMVSDKNIFCAPPYLQRTKTGKLQSLRTWKRERSPNLERTEKS